MGSSFSNSMQRFSSPQPVELFKRFHRHQARLMTADEVYDQIKEVADEYGLPVEVDGSADRIPVVIRSLNGWELYAFPHTYPVRVERRGDLPDRSDDLWTPLWTLFDRWETSREAVEPLSAKGYRLFRRDPRRTAREKLLSKMGT